jgi:Tol biopolymer transport system component
LETLSTWSAGEVHEVGPGTTIDLTWSPDGSALVYTGSSLDGRGYDYIIVDADGGGELARFPGTPRREPAYFAWNADGSALMGRFTEHTVSVYDARGQNGVVIDSEALDAVWLEDGLHVGVVTEHEVRIARANGSGIVMTIDATGAWLR